MGSVLFLLFTEPEIKRSMLLMTRSVWSGESFIDSYLVFEIGYVIYREISPWTPGGQTKRV